MRKQKGAAGSQSSSLQCWCWGCADADTDTDADGARAEDDSGSGLPEGVGGGPSRWAVLTKAQLLSAANMFLSVVKGEPCGEEETGSKGAEKAVRGWGRRPVDIHGKRGSLGLED